MATLEAIKVLSPYAGLPRRQFWRSGVMESSPIDPRGYYSKKFEIAESDNIVTAGSCFAQHISRQLRSRGYNVLDVERAPKSLPEPDRSNYGYGLYSARYGNIYTVRQLRQLLEEASGLRVSPDPVWEARGRFYDSARPSVEPDGLDSMDEVLLHRKYHLERVRQLFSECDLLVFTLGLTETWRLTSTDWVFPTAPGTIAGQWDEGKYEFHNFSTSEILQDFSVVQALIQGLRGAGRPTKYLLTVSPVPLTASYVPQHVLVSTSYSKSVLRAVAGELALQSDDIDYFPSFEIISNPWTRGVFYEANCRSVTPAGVSTVMKAFFAEHIFASDTRDNPNGVFGKVKCVSQDISALEESRCEEELLSQFQRAGS